MMSRVVPPLLSASLGRTRDKKISLLSAFSPRRVYNAMYKLGLLRGWMYVLAFW